MENSKWPDYNKKLNLYEQRWNIDLDLIINEHQNKFNFENLGEVILKIKKKFKQKEKNKQNNICQFCGANNPKLKCKNKGCNYFYCCEEHRNLDYISFHFFHCKILNFFTSNKYKEQIVFFNDLIIVIGNIIKDMFSLIENKIDYLIYIPFLQIILNLFQKFKINYISEIIFSNTNKTKSKKEIKSFYFYQEVIFFYYNIIILILNFGIKGDKLDFVKKELENISNENELPFNKKNFLSLSFKKELELLQEPIDFSKDNYFFIDKEYLRTSYFLKQNTILLNHIIHFYGNLIHIIDYLCKIKPLERINFKTLDIKLKSQLIILFEERCHDNPDSTYYHFYTYMAPHMVLNQKMILAEKFLKKSNNILSNGNISNTIFNALISFNLGIIQFACGKFLEGIHNLENAYKIVYYNDFSDHLKIMIIEKLALAYLNIGELLKSYHMLREALNLRENLLGYENKVKILHLTIYINYIKDFIEYEQKLKLIGNKEDTLNKLTHRQYQKYLVDFVLGKNEYKTKCILDNYSNDYFNACEFIYNLSKELQNKLNNDNQSKKSLIISKEEQNENDNKLIISQSDLSTTSAYNNPIKEFNEKEEILEFDDELEIKEPFYDQLQRFEQVKLTSINNHFFMRSFVLRDFYGPINFFNINYHPLYTNEFKEIIENTKHHFFLKQLTHSDISDLGKYFYDKENRNLEGLSRYISQEEIQNMIEIEIENIYSEPIEYGVKIINEDKNKIKEKEKWILMVKEGLLKDKNKSFFKIDDALSLLYDNLNDEYKDAIINNPELILYYLLYDTNFQKGKIKVV